MALRALMIRAKIDKAKETLESLRGKDESFKIREEELEKSIEEASTQEEQDVVQKAIEDFETEKSEHEEDKNNLETEISDLEKELVETEKEPPKKRKKEKMETGKETIMENRDRFFGMNIQERDAFFMREDVRTFIGKVRSCIKEKRALENVGLTIPDIMLPMIRQKASEYSKLMRRVTVRPVGGTSRQNVMGDIPEAYWDDMCASIKEMDMAFYNMEMDGYKVSGYFAVCNAILNDSDINLMTELIDAIGRAIGKALDKAILYGRSGKNVKMPTGIVKSLTTATAPEGYPDTARAWVDLSGTNIIAGTTGATGTKLFQNIVIASGVVDNDYETGELTWCMNKKTHTKLLSESVGINSSAAIVSGMNSTMPIVGGEIIELSFIPDNTIIFGYFKNYLLVEREGSTIDQSEHVKFLEDQTVFRGRARYDGNLMIREAFGIYGVGKAPDTKAPLFAGETAEETKAK